MQAMKEFSWAQDKVEGVTRMTKEQREQQACARRLEQMAKKREKQAKRLAAQGASK